jgi:TetR/AcrR family transcriptional regulator, fatty acid metabolism regulator protein
MIDPTRYISDMIPEIFASDPSWPYSKAKTAVLSAASIVIREDGPRAATLKNIATKAGITEPAIFRHFDGVDGLFGGLFTVYERIYERAFAVFSSEEDQHGLAKLRKVGSSVAEYLSSSRDFAYILVYARHVFRGYPELKASVSERDAKGQSLVLACINESIKAGELRSDLDPVSIATSFIGALYITAIFWIESGFAFDICEVFADRMDDCVRMVAPKPAAKSREAKASSRDRAESYFPLHPFVAPRAKAGSARVKAKTKAKKSSSSGKSESSRKPSKASKPSLKPVSRAASRRAVAAKATIKKPTTRSK